MTINIRESIKNNFKDCSLDDYKESIEESIIEKDEISLPGLGVFFEVLWLNSSDTEKDNIVKLISTNIN